MTSRDYLHKAFLLAKSANLKQIRPNPFVGAIVVSQEGEIIGEGYHQKAGEAHAEVFAIQAALLKKPNLSEATLYVTLEPCSHIGKTPACTDLIIQHKIKKVVIGSLDPNPLVSGAKKLADHGVIVETIITPEIVELNNVFNINQIKKRPKYILKSATTINGQIADRFGNSKWISNAKSRAYVHEFLRARVDAILTTAKTIMNDNASMNIRLEGTAPTELNLIVIDKHLDLLKKENEQLPIFYKRTNSKIYLVTDKSFEGKLRTDVELIKVDMRNKKIDLTQLSTQLLSKNIYEVLIESGGILNASMIQEKLVDEVFMFICPSINSDSSALNAFSSNQVQKMDELMKLSLLETKVFDDDILLKYKVLITKS